jgi:NAD(P)-dependent dehydrogenase (short-subunit alcohol dehydrogenase family)
VFSSSADSAANITSYICDITDRAQIDSVATRLRTEVGEPTIVINNAGVVKGKLLLDLSAEEVQT